MRVIISGVPFDVVLLRALATGGDLERAAKATRILNMIATGYAVSDGAWPADPYWQPDEPEDG